MDHREMWKHHLMLSATYQQLAMKYMYINPQVHHQYYLKHLEHAQAMERHFLAMQNHQGHQNHDAR
jgi:hypothetical protein